MPSRATATATAPEAARRALVWAALVVASASASADPGVAVGGIYSCTDANGKVLRSDRPIADCNARAQKILNSDGSVRSVVPPALSPEEQATADERQRAEDTLRAARNDAVRRDRNLLLRYSDEAAHRKAREAALDEKRASIAISEKRLATLAAERKPLEDERAFYVGKPLPFKLRLAFDANDATTAGTRDALANQQADVVRINARFDEELARLRKLWSGTPPGTLPPVVAASAAAKIPGR